ncbi:MAG: aldose 1-epimerase family protein [Ruminococcaceae bacterium]|nr:aldose 1-epimerase family protein [Oscillospiraceae bacterium]
MKFEIKSREATVILGLEGAMLNSLKKDGIEYLWQGDPAVWAGQAPVCFPIVGVLPEHKGYAFGKECNMKRHGVARISPFEVFEQFDNSITFIQKSSDETKKAFPFDYELKIKYTIIGSTVTTEYIITNTGSEKFPFAIGGHPAFNCPLTSGESFDDYKVVFDKKMTKKYLRPNHRTGIIDINERFDCLENSDEIQMDYSLFGEKDSMIFDDIESKCATLIGKAGRGVKIEYQDMANLLIWSAYDSDFVALEPWTGISNCSDETDIIEDKRGINILFPNETASFKFKITMI